jgi:uncharacterized protein with FMN-binding domain
MRRAIVVVVLTIAGLIPLLRFHPNGLPPSQAASRTGGQPAATGAPPAGGSGDTVDGSTVDTEFGPYQVRVSFSGRTITDVQIITEPPDRRSQRIASRAAPTLRTEALQAQSAHIDTVSGATITSEAYAQSLQAAIDAHG